MVSKNMRIPGGMHIESGWADEERRQKNDAQLRHEEKIFGKEEKEAKDELAAYIKGQLGFGV